MVPRLSLAAASFALAACSSMTAPPPPQPRSPSLVTAAPAPQLESVRPAPPELAPGVSPGDTFFDFGLPRLDWEKRELGDLVWLSDMVGRSPAMPKRVVLLNFFATWCAPCFTEMRVLNEWQERYGPRGLQILGLNYRAPVQDVAEILVTTLESVPANLQFPLLFERHTLRNQSAYLGDGEVVLPANVLLDASGQVIARSHGADEEVLDQLRRIIESRVEGE